MNKSILFFGVVVFFIITWLVGFVNSLEDEVDVGIGFNEKDKVEGESKYTIVNSSGDEVLLLDKLSLQKQKRLWNNSMLKNDFMELFPNFIDMKYFVEDHIEDEGAFKKELLENIRKVEVEYVSGRVTEERAKSMLMNI